MFSTVTVREVEISWCHYWQQSTKDSPRR